MNVKWTAVLLVVGLLSPNVLASDVAPGDAKAIKESVANYLGGWFSSDPDRMRKALHPNLSKYTVKTIPGTKLEYLDGIDAESLIAFTAHNQEWVKDKRYHEMKIVYQDERLPQKCQEPSGCCFSIKDFVSSPTNGCEFDRPSPRSEDKTNASSQR